MEPKRKLQWKVNTPQLLKEIGENNPTLSMMGAPLQIFANILTEVAQRAIELNDDQLNALMCRLALYEESDPYSKDFNQKLVDKVIEKGSKS